MIGKLKAASDFIKDRFGRIDVAIITGTGINIEITGDKRGEIAYSLVPNMSTPSTKSHEGYFEYIQKDELGVVIAHGRFHYYERYSMQEVVFLPRVVGLLNPELVILTNAAGGLNPMLKEGDLMIIRDHINMMGANPLKGDNIDQLGERFPDMSQPYSLKYIEKLKSVALRNGVDVKEGVYVGVAGPSLETPAETRFFRLIGADAIGMSTIPEVIALNHMGVDRIVVSIITNENRPDCMKETSIDDVIKTADKVSPKLSFLLDKFLEEGL